MFGLSPQILILIASCAASVAGGWRATAWYYQAEIAGMRADKAKAAQMAEQGNRKIMELQLDLGNIVIHNDAARKEKIRTVTVEVTRDVIKYVQKPVPVPVRGECRLDTDWLRIHNRAAGSGMPEDAGPAIGADDGATYADAVATVTENYRICNETRSQLIGLQEWAGSLKNLN